MSALLAYASSSDEEDDGGVATPAPTRPVAAVVDIAPKAAASKAPKEDAVDPAVARRVDALRATYGVGKAGYFENVLGKDASNPAYMIKLCKAFMVEESASNLPKAHDPSALPAGANYKALARAQAEAEHKRAEQRQVQGGGAGFGTAHGAANPAPRFQPWGAGGGGAGAGGGGGGGAGSAKRATAAGAVASETKAPASETAIERAQRVAREIAARMGSGAPAAKRQRRS